MAHQYSFMNNFYYSLLCLRLLSVFFYNKFELLSSDHRLFVSVCVCVCVCYDFNKPFNLNKALALASLKLQNKLSFLRSLI